MTPIKFGFLGRQILFALVLTILLLFGTVALVILTPEGPLGLVGVIAASGFYLWLLIRQTSGHGNASIEEDGLLVEPTRFSICGVRRLLRIPWGRIESVNIIHFGNIRCPFLMLRRFTRPNLLIVSLVSESDRGFLDHVLKQAVAWHGAHPEAPPLRQDDFFAGMLWKSFGALLIGAFLFFVIAIFQSGRAGEWILWLRLFGISGLLFPLVRRIFRPTDFTP